MTTPPRTKRVLEPNCQTEALEKAVDSLATSDFASEMSPIMP
eukprot:CAMPEP_0115177974 /NCGR_PEP_ID=MMETSP0270-20121206/5659_1 /TAXON_ID=71861 /ORGANISM="Scrippsiella trochoidea, Strain CCMP3099" /LENGTH=41 /DNA_ID= /DNA_START= /DNA_END= /DNA_ORIENTATION=